jgi:hypothetical protein
VDPSFSKFERDSVWLRMRLEDSGPITAGVTAPYKFLGQIERGPRPFYSAILLVG